MHRRVTNAARPRGFTLVELLIVIGIIVLLIGILMPVISNVRKAAYEADTKAELSQLSAAIQRYHAEFKAYPGPIRNSDFGADGRAAGAANMTMTENAVFGLLGGWEYGNTYDDTKVGTGPIIHNANAVSRRRLAPFVEGAVGTILPARPFAASGLPGATDTALPEFIDKFPDPMPIIYLRANVGQDGIVGANNTFQYNSNHLLPYGVDNSDISTADFTHGLISYLRNPNIAATETNATTVNDTGTPKSKDGFILVAAGQDRLFGTKDDNFQVP